MQSLRPTIFISLWICSSFSPVHSLNCRTTQYPWPIENPHLCCDKCPPGEYFVHRNPEICEIECKPCTDKRYNDNYNLEYCKLCNDCEKDNREYVSHCNSTHNSVCRCKAGYKCDNEDCTHCSPLPPTTISATTTLSPPTKGVLRPTSIPIKDTEWFLVIISLLCVGIALVIISKIKPVVSWFDHMKGYCLARKPGVYTEEEDVCQPVQEMCGKCDQPIEV